MGYVEGMDRRQTILFPETVDEYIEEDNPVQFVDAFVDSLDLKELEFKYSEPELTGRPPYNPSDMLKLYLYGYLNRRFQEGQQEGDNEGMPGVHDSVQET